VDSQITVQPKLTEPRRIVEDFAAGEDEDISKKIMMSINWVISEGSLAPVFRIFFRERGVMDRFE